MLLLLIVILRLLIGISLVLIILVHILLLAYVLLIDWWVIGRLWEVLSLVGLSCGRITVGVDPFNLKVSIVFTEVVIIKGLLGKEGRHDILESHQSKSLLWLYSNFLYFSEYFEHLFSMNYIYYIYLRFLCLTWSMKNFFDAIPYIESVKGLLLVSKLGSLWEVPIG